jgi:hypothetical protein
MGRPVVFLSSTVRDLGPYRRHVAEQLGRLGYATVLGEEFGARDADAAESSLVEIARCQVFVGVYARRYGFLPPSRNPRRISVTEMEYDEAVRLDLPRLLFVLRGSSIGQTDEATVQGLQAVPDDEKRPSDFLAAYRDDHLSESGEKLSQFLLRVGQERVWSEFSTPEDLAAEVALAVSRLEGWRPPQLISTDERFVGREALLDQVTATFVEGSRTALVGIPGIGKTTLAHRAAHQSAGSFSGGVFWNSLGPEARDADAVLAQSMSKWALSHPIGRLAAASKLSARDLRRWLSEAPGPLLFVLDDVWHLGPVPRFCFHHGRVNTLEIIPSAQHDVDVVYDVLAD